MATFSFVNVSSSQQEAQDFMTYILPRRHQCLKKLPFVQARSIGMHLEDRDNCQTLAPITQVDIRIVVKDENVIELKKRKGRPVSPLCS